ncbi:Hypothetical predicted protein [Podarcis lilfordi]|uniref:Uncharacterized protein n=1 Tax=Podarcis lilfordi TaxID=74358 RepID=A0AA35VQV9_9SAUR|nr:Hypothetical predicted protein [Podarcis lilfordi]
MQGPEMPFIRGGPGIYKVVKTSPLGHAIRGCPNLRGLPNGMLVLGHKVKAVGESMIYPSTGSCAVLKKKESDKNNKKSKRKRRRKKRLD